MQRYFHSLKFEVGQVFPIANPYPNAGEGSILFPHARGVHFVVYSNYVEHDAVLFRGQTLDLGLTTFRNIPFVALTVPGNGIVFSYSLNMYGIVGDDRRAWLRAEPEEMSFLLVDNQTGMLVLIRRANVPIWQKKLQEVAGLQLDHYEGFDEVKAEQDRLLKKYNALQIMKSAQEREFMRTAEPGTWYVQLLPPNV